MIYFLLYLFLETSCSVPAFSALGVLGTFAEIIGSAFVGIFLLVNSRFTLGESFNALRQGSISPQTFQTVSMMTVLGAFLLILPGIFTDILGILMQFGFISTIFAGYLTKKENTQTRRNEDEDIIDVEVIEHSDTK